jgi:hypothetical protein
MRSNMLTLNKAKRLALDGVARATGYASDDLRIVDGQTQCKRAGWFFRYESRAYVETGVLAYAIGDTGPVVVTHRGVVHLLRGGVAEEEAFAEFERYVAECTTLEA